MKLYLLKKKKTVDAQRYLRYMSGLDRGRRRMNKEEGDEREIKRVTRRGEDAEEDF